MRFDKRAVAAAVFCATAAPVASLVAPGASALEVRSPNPAFQACQLAPGESQLGSIENATLYTPDGKTRVAWRAATTGNANIVQALELASGDSPNLAFWKGEKKEKFVDSHPISSGSFVCHTVTVPSGSNLALSADCRSTSTKSWTGGLNLSGGATGIHRTGSLSQALRQGKKNADVAASCTK